VLAKATALVTVSFMRFFGNVQFMQQKGVRSVVALAKKMTNIRELRMNAGYKTGSIMEKITYENAKVFGRFK
jgi:hypothetical protein